MSNRLTFSLASLIVLIAFGLIFGITDVLAHTGDLANLRVHGHPTPILAAQDLNGDNDTEDKGEGRVTGHNDHPQPVVSLVPKQSNVDYDNNTIVVKDGAATFKVQVDFGVDVTGEQDDTVADATLTLTPPNVFVLNAAKTMRVGGASGASITAFARQADTNQILEATVTIGTGALPTDDTETFFRIAAIAAGQVSSLKLLGITNEAGDNTEDVDGTLNYASAGDFLEFKLIKAFPNKKPAVTATPPATPVKVKTATVPFTVSDGDSGDTVTMAAELDADSVTAGYTIDTATPAVTNGAGSVVITGPDHSTDTGRTILARGVTLTLTPNDGTDDGTPLEITVNFAARTNTAPTLTIRTSKPTSAVNDYFHVDFETKDADGDTVVVAASRSVDPTTALGKYHVDWNRNSAGEPKNPTPATGVFIWQVISQIAGESTPGATVTLTLTPSDALGNGESVDLEVPYAPRPFDAADFDFTPPVVIVGDVADDQSGDFEVRFSITDQGNSSGPDDTTKASGFKLDKDGNIPVFPGAGVKANEADVSITLIEPKEGTPGYETVASIGKIREARPHRIVDPDTGDVIFASFSVIIEPTRKDLTNRVGIRIRVDAADRAGYRSSHEISVTLGPREFIPDVRSNPNIISCLKGSEITVHFGRKLVENEVLTASEIILLDPDKLKNPKKPTSAELETAKAGWEVVGGITHTRPVGIDNMDTATFKVMPKSDRSWVGQTSLMVYIVPEAVKDLGANPNSTNEHDVVKDAKGNVLFDVRPHDRFPQRKGTFTIGPVLAINPGGYIAVVRDKKEFGIDTMTASHLGDTTLTVADKNVRAEDAEVQGWECMPDLGVLLGITPYRDEKENDRGSSTFLAVTGGGGIIVKQSPEQLYLNKANLAKGTVGISEMMWAVDRSKLFGAHSNVEQAQEQWIELHNLNGGTTPVYVTLFDLVLAETYQTYGTELDRMSNFGSSPTSDRWAIRDDYKKGRDGDSDYGRDFVAMQRVDNTDLAKAKIPTLARNYSHKDYAGTHKDKWIASQAVYLTRTSRLATVGAYNLPYEQLNYDFIGTPARKNTLLAVDPPADQVKPTAIPRSPVIFNEIANRINANRYYEWIELRNVTASEVNLRNYNISYITAVGTEMTLYEFPNNDNIKIAANGILLLVDTEPKNRKGHPVAIDNPNVKYAVTDFVGNGLPDSGEFVLVLRHPEAADKAGTAKAKQGTHERVVDIAGYHPDLAEAGAPRYTKLWPLKNFAAPNLLNNKLDVETVHRRQQAGVDGTNTTGDGNHIDKTAFRDAGYTGIGYKRLISDIPAHGGTPGYANNVVKEYNDDKVTTSAAPVTISEVMYHTGSSTRLLPQWIELYNSSMTEVVKVEDWTLQLENADDVSIRAPRVSVKLAAKQIQPNQTVLIVASSTGNHSDHFPDMRVIDIFGNGLKDKDRLEIASTVNRRTFRFLSEKEFKITLKDKAGAVVDTIGNLGADPAWDLPEEGDNRSSLIRRYDDGVARDGTMPAWSSKGSLGDAGGKGNAAWVLASSSGLYETQDDTYYGNVTDEGSPGYRGGGPLPVSLSKFRPERLDDGSIVVRWITESELNNAGFNILRSETKDGEYTKLNTKLIAGQGTTSEKTTYEYPDTSAKPNVVYYYQIQDVSLDGKVTTLRVNRLKGHISAAGKLTTTWGELKALQ